MPAVLSVGLSLLYAFRRSLIPAWTDTSVDTYLLAALTVAAGVLLERLVSYFLLDVLFRRRKGRQAPQLLRMVVSLIAYALIFAVVYYRIFEKNLSGLLATSAVFTVILGLALQDTLGNFFAGISIHIEQPYQIGDALQVSNVVGRVESVTWRTTTVRTGNNSTVVYPNSKIARDPIEIFRLDSLNRRILRFPAPYPVAPGKVMQLASGIAAGVPGVSTEKLPTVRVAEFSDSCITYEVLFWIKDYMRAPDIDALIRERLWYGLWREGIEFPYPVRHVLHETREPHPPEQVEHYETFLAGIDMLKPLSAQELAEVAGSVVRLRFAPGETVLRTGEAGDSMYVIHRGQAEVLAPDPRGSLHPVAVLQPGNIFGEMGLFTGEPRRADVRAVRELELLEVRKPVMKDLFTGNQSLVDSFSQIITQRQAELLQLADTAAGLPKPTPVETVLHRIKRFFSLS